MTYSWFKTESEVICEAPTGVVLRDSIDHWDNAFRRLMALSETEAKVFAETVFSLAKVPFTDCTAKQKIEALKLASSQFFQKSKSQKIISEHIKNKELSVLDSPVDYIWANAIREDESIFIAGSSTLQHGRLFNSLDASPATPPNYEEEYFEGGIAGIGYGEYASQSTWRMEKSRRYVKRIKDIAQLSGRPLSAESNLLDLGSGYGFFRAAAEEEGWTHTGFEVSNHAAMVCQKMFGFDTFRGELQELRSREKSAYDLITLFDIIEHIENPANFITTVFDLLKPGGRCVIRTPNIQCLEMEIFGPYQHSLKAEHLHYFSPNSLSYVTEHSGFITDFITTESHLLSGFLGPHLASLKQLLRGSDIFFVASKPL